ncbi:MAG: TIGR04282 family arsenosugar biosynthesis glycosyltransferase [Saprospiraceae bacterium]|nr:TIGR04282 family arsenosugar biosynthesis glycosyltransferase [Saprospiraceae bacterium]
MIIFIKNPVKGKVKTRLANDIGESEALGVYQKLLEYTREVTTAVKADKMLFYSETIEPDDEWSEEHYKKFVQKGNDLGQRMLNAFESTLQKYDSALIIGSDCPGLDQSHISEGFMSLRQSDVVIGPSEDGGYYLLGMNHLHEELFRNIKWSSESVLEETIQGCKNAGLSYQLLAQLNDIDRATDLTDYPWLQSDG